MVRRSTEDAAVDWKRHFSDDSPGPFALVSQNLMTLGSIAIERFLSSATVDADIPYNAEKPVAPPSPPRSPLYTSDSPQMPETKVPKPNASTKMQTVARLHQTCQRVFGNTDALRFEFLEESGPSSKQCILTITRSDGLTRSYTTQPVFARKNEAKAHVASIAIDMGAIDFIVTGDADPSKPKKGLVLAPLDSADRLAVESTSADLRGEIDPSIKEIEDCCKRWRAGVTPHWVDLTESKIGNKHGAALRIGLSPHSCRVYSSETAHDSIFDAKQACAKIALHQGVLEYIKFGNGQAQPSAPDTSTEETKEEIQEESVGSQVLALSSANALQSFYEALPKPFPEDFGNKLACEINAPAWVNTTIQAARGGKLSSHFIWITDTFGLHGCLLRIDRPGESKSYLVDTRFPKRADAKAAVCLQAMSQGVGSYIRGIGAAVDNKITPAMKKVASQILPVLALECNKVRPGGHPIYDFNKDRDAYGCTMKVELSAFPSHEDIKEYTVPAEYRTKADAKVAVALLGAQQGILELLQFRGESPPSGYVASLATRSKDVTNEPRNNKRKDIDRPDFQDGGNRKKRRKGNRNSQGDVPFLRIREEGLASRRTHTLPSRPFDSQSTGHNAHNKGSWKRHRASGSGGLGSISGPAQSGRLVDQYRSGSRDVGDFATPPQGSHLNSLNGSHLPGHLVCGGGQVAPYNVAPHRPPSEPFQGGAYPPPIIHPNYGIPSRAAVDTAHYAPSPYAPQHDLMHNSGYMPPYGNVYPPSHYAQSYQPAVLPSYARHPPAVYAAGSQPVVATGPTPSDYTSAASYVPNYYRIPPQHLYHNPSPEHSARNMLGTAQALHGPGESPSGKREALSEQEPGQIDGSSGLPISNKECDQESRHTFSSDHPVGQKLRASTERSGPSSSSQDATPDSGPKTKPIITIEQPPKSHVTALLDYCDKDGSPRPQFHNEIVKASNGETSYKVWVILGMERLELPLTFPSLDKGRERVAKQVLGRLRSQGNQSKGKIAGMQRES